jgi:hypothetical protein
LPCDVLLAPHASFFHQDERRAKIVEGAPSPFVDPAACVTYLERSEQAFRAHLEKERSKPAVMPAAATTPPPASAARLR